MKHNERLTFIVASNNEEVLRKNLLASPALGPGCRHQIIVKRNYASIGTAFNEAIDETGNDILVFLHQDIVLPEGWDDRLLDSIAELERGGAAWGVVGCYGTTKDNSPAGHVYSNGLQRELGTAGEAPTEVAVLDEIVLVLRKSSGLRFDPRLPGFHMYGTDICLEAQERSLACYAVSNFCLHNSLPIRRLGPDFWRCVFFIRRKWWSRLPIRTNIVPITRNSFRLHYVRLRKAISYFRHRGEKTAIRRQENITSVMP